jgi:hypothetical protein
MIFARGRFALRRLANAVDLFRESLWKLSHWLRSQQTRNQRLLLLGNREQCFLFPFEERTAPGLLDKDDSRFIPNFVALTGCRLATIGVAGSVRVHSPAGPATLASNFSNERILFGSHSAVITFWCRINTVD